MSTVEKTLPYAPLEAVNSVLDAYRDRLTPRALITVDTLARLNVQETIIPRTARTLTWLGLTDETGLPTPTFEDFRIAENPETVLRDVLYSSYSEVFQFWRPEDGVAKLESVMRTFEPVSMRPRMVKLFLGLCARAGLVDPEDVPQRGRKKTAAPNGAKAATTTKAERRAQRRQHDRERENQQIPPRADAHPFIQGLLASLPATGAVWPEQKRQSWLKAAEAAFDMIFERPPEKTAPDAEASAAIGGDDDA